jgi:thiosulfate/3-mercaptopyruvate sulfurtransferase
LHRSGRGGRRHLPYDGGHLTGAVRLDWTTDLQDSVIRDVVNKKKFGELLSKGISNDDTTVLYGGNRNWFAAHAYWYLKLKGHGSVRPLDGGRKE